MGLDISVYTKVNKVGEAADFEEYETSFDRKITFYVYEGSNHPFNEQLGFLEPGAVYGFADTWGFRAGSYGGYGAWRAELCRMATGIDHITFCDRRHLYKDKPFYFLLWFSDAEGFISGDTAKKLANDFNEFESKAASIGGGFFVMYKQWQRAFNEGDVVQFH